VHTVTEKNSVWIANPNATENYTTFSDATFFVSSASHAVGFLANNSITTGDDVASGFSFYGHMAVVVSSSGGWQSGFYAKATDVDGLWSLGWNFTHVDGAISITLNASPPNQAGRTLG